MRLLFCLLCAAVSSAQSEFKDRDLLGQALMDASENGDTESVLKALELGADPNWEDADKWRPLQNAANGGHFEMARALVKAGADVNFRAGKTKWTALHWCAERNHVDIAKLLIENGADVSVACYRKRTPKQLARAQEQLQVLKVLQDREDELAKDASLGEEL